MYVNPAGELKVFEKIRGKKKLIGATVDKMVEHAKGGENYQGKYFIGHFNALSEAEAMKAAIEARIPKIKDGVRIFNIGKTIGAHSGPGTIAVFFWGDDRVDLK